MTNIIEITVMYELITWLNISNSTSSYIYLLDLNQVLSELFVLSFMYVLSIHICSLRAYTPWTFYHFTFRADFCLVTGADPGGALGARAPPDHQK